METASSAAEAMAAVERRRPDAAIIDVTVPRISGLALARQIIDLGVPALVISGVPTYLERLTEVGCPFLAKPFRVEGLMAVLKPLLENGEAQLAPLRAGLDRLAATQS